MEKYIVIARELLEGIENAKDLETVKALFAKAGSAVAVEVKADQRRDAAQAIIAAADEKIAAAEAEKAEAEATLTEVPDGRRN